MVAAAPASEPQRDEGDGPAHAPSWRRCAAGATQARPKPWLRPGDPSGAASAAVVSSGRHGIGARDRGRPADPRDARPRRSPTTATPSAPRRAAPMPSAWSSTGGPTSSCSTSGFPTSTAPTCSAWCAASRRVPVIVATARDDEAEVVRLLDAGADDYVIKPYSAAQLDARIRAVLRRARRGRRRRARAALVVGDLEVDPDRRTATPGRRAARALPAGVRPARPPGAALAGGGHPPGAPRRGVAPAPRRRRQDDRRPPVLAAPEARRVGHASRATSTPCAASASSSSNRAPERRSAMRRRLFLVTLAVTTLLVAAFAIPLALLVRDVARDRAISDAEADQAALAPVLAVEPDPEELDGRHRAHAVWPGRTASRCSCRTAPSSATRPSSNPDSVALAREQQRAFSRVGRRGHRRVHARWCSAPARSSCCACTCRTRWPPKAWRPRGWCWRSSPWCCWWSPSLATDRLARSVTRPAADLARTSRALAGGDTHARADVAGPPEIADVAEALNLLADRIDELRVAERERVADLSHRLRTPLTALPPRRRGPRRRRSSSRTSTASRPR